MIELLRTAKTFDKLIAAKDVDPQYFYRPHPDQLAFHKSPAATRIVIGGNRSGKSHMGINEDLWTALGTHPYIQPPIPNRGRIGVSDFKILEQVIWPKIVQWLPQGEVAEFRRGYRGIITGVLFRNGSFFDVMSYEQPPMKWESVDLDWCHFDEPPSYEIYKSTRARLIDRDGRMWFTLTPLEEPWILDEIWEKCGKNPRYWGINVDMRKNPYLSRKAVNTYLEEVTQDDYDARVRGQFRHLIGRVFKDYTDEYPYVMTKAQANIKADWPRMLVIDPHEKTPWALQWYAHDENNDTVFRIDDVRHDPSDGIEAFGRLVRAIEAGHNAPVPSHMRISDSYGQKPTYNKGGNSLLDEIAEITGLEFRSADKTDTNGRLWDLIYRYKINPVTRIPRFITLEHCEHSRKEIIRYVWDKHRTKAGQWSEEKQNPVKKNDHAISCDHYMAAEWPSTYRAADPINVFNQEDASTEDDNLLDFDGRPLDPAEIHSIAEIARRSNRGQRRMKGRRNAFYR